MGIAINRASGINIFAEIRCADRKFDGGKRLNDSSGGGPLSRIVFGKLIESGLDVNRNASKLRSVNFQHLQLAMVVPV